MADLVYFQLLSDILSDGCRKGDRTGVGTLSVFGNQYTYNLRPFPILTTKKVFWKGVVHELLWFIRGETNLSYLHEHGIHFWDANAHDAYCKKYGHIPMEDYLSLVQTHPEYGDLGRIYGYQWNRENQLESIVEGIKSNPHGRRHIVSAWNFPDLDQSALPPCHMMFQFYVRGAELDCKMYQRSGDAFLGVPFNIASYALLTYMVAHITGLTPGRLIHTFGDLHLYLNHIDAAEEQLKRTPMNPPSLRIRDRGQTRLKDFVFEDIELVGYRHGGLISAPMAV